MLGQLRHDVFGSQENVKVDITFFDLFEEGWGGDGNGGGAASGVGEGHFKPETGFSGDNIGGDGAGKAGIVEFFDEDDGIVEGVDFGAVNLTANGLIALGTDFFLDGFV